MWLRNLAQNRDALVPILEETCGSEADRWHRRWRVFFMAMAEQFGAGSGEEWWIVHQLLEKPGERWPGRPDRARTPSLKSPKFPESFACFRSSSRITNCFHLFLQNQVPGIDLNGCSPYKSPRLG